MKKLPVLFAAAALLAAIPASAAEEAGGAEFGNPGVINFGAATNLDLTIGSRKAPDSAGGVKTSHTEFNIAPSIDYFVIEGLSVGAFVGFNTRSEKKEGASDSDSATTISLAPRVGYNLWLTPGQLSLWPQLSFVYASTSTKGGGKDGPTLSTTGIDLFVPVLIHPVKHFHFAVGPFFGTDLSSSISQNGASTDGEKDTRFGLRGEIAGWL